MMMDYAIVPHWFLGYNVFLEIVFALIALLVGVYAIKIYKLTNQRPMKLFGISFLFLSAAYFIQTLLNFLSSYAMIEGCSMQSMTKMHAFNFAGIYAHVFLFVAGLVTLAYMTLRIKNIKAYFLFLAVVIIALILSSNLLYFFYVISSILLIYISFYYFRNYLKSKKTSSLIVFVAFLFLLFGKIHFIFSVNHGAYYVAGHLLELVAYILILINLLVIIKRK